MAVALERVLLLQLLLLWLRLLLRPAVQAGRRVLLIFWAPLLLGLGGSHGHWPRPLLQLAVGVVPERRAHQARPARVGAAAGVVVVVVVVVLVGPHVAAERAGALMQLLLLVLLVGVLAPLAGVAWSCG